MKSTGSKLAFIRVLRLGIRLWTSSEDFGLLRKTSDFFGRLQTSSGIFVSSSKIPALSQDKNLTPITQKKLAGIAQVRRLFLRQRRATAGNMSAFACYCVGNFEESYGCTGLDQKVRRLCSSRFTIFNDLYQNPKRCSSMSPTNFKGRLGSFEDFHLGSVLPISTDGRQKALATSLREIGYFFLFKGRFLTAPCS